MNTKLMWNEDEEEGENCWFAKTPKWLYNIHCYKDRGVPFTASRRPQADTPDGGRREVDGVEVLEEDSPTLEGAMEVAENWHKERDGDNQAEFDAPYCPHCHRRLTASDLKQINRLP